MDVSKIDPWVDPAPSNANTMTLLKLQQKIKKKKPWAYRQMAKRYQDGNGVRQSLQLAIDNFKKGVGRGDPYCMLHVGKMYEHGTMAIDKIIIKAVYFIGKIIILIGAFIGCNNNYYINIGLIVMAIINYKFRIRIGDPNCMLCMGYLYEHVEVELAIYFIGLSIFIGAFKACNFWIDCDGIYFGLIVMVNIYVILLVLDLIECFICIDRKLAFEHYQMGALKGFDAAQYTVGTYYFNGNYVEQSNIKAREWYTRAAAQGLKEAIESLKFLDEKEKVSQEKKAATEEKEADEKKEADKKKEKEEKKQTDEKKEEERQLKIMQEEKIKSEMTSASIENLKLLDKEEKVSEEKRAATKEKETNEKKAEQEERKPQIMQEKEEKEEPTTTVTKKKIGLFCLNCSRPYTNQTKHMFRRCSMCDGRDAIFCGPLCQKLTWPDHRDECTLTPFTATSSRLYWHHSS